MILIDTILLISYAVTRKGKSKKNTRQFIVIKTNYTPRPNKIGLTAIQKSQTKNLSEDITKETRIRLLLMKNFHSRNGKIEEKSDYKNLTSNKICRMV